MMQSVHPMPLVETLLNTLEAERYMRGPLLRTISDELATTEGLEGAAAAAREILEGLESGGLVESEFTRRLVALRRLVQASTMPPVSGVRVSEPREPVARAVPGATTASAA
jgi:hypothetical protein